LKVSDQSYDSGSFFHRRYINKLLKKRIENSKFETFIQYSKIFQLTIFIFIAAFEKACSIKFGVLCLVGFRGVTNTVGTLVVKCCVYFKLKAYCYFNLNNECRRSSLTGN